MIGVVDYDAGNLRSVETALHHLGHQHTISQDPEVLASCEILMVPGVGEARAAMRVMRDRGLDTVIRRHASAGRLTIGVCLGCQLFVEHSEEGDTECLGLLQGKVVRFPHGKGEKVPHMGWNQVRWVGGHRITGAVPSDRSFYFVHSYYVERESAPDTAATTDYLGDFTSVLARDHIVAFQFHPEKSGRYGLRLLDSAIRGGGDA